MTTNPNDELTRAEREAYASLREGFAPPEALEERVVAAMRSRGLLGPRRPRLMAAGRWVAALAAGVLLFVAGLAIGRGSAPAPVRSESPRFMLLLHEDGQYEEVPPDAVAGRVDEYRRWASRLQEAGHFVTGEKLEARGAVLSRGGSSAMEPAETTADDTIAGFFIISADSYDAALALARDCPHLLHGGRIEVRPIDPV